MGNTSGTQNQSSSQSHNSMRGNEGLKNSNQSSSGSKSTSQMGRDRDTNTSNSGSR